MKNLKIILFATFALLVLAACQGSNNNPATTTATCTPSQYSPYGQTNPYGQSVPGCISPYNTGLYGNSMYGTNPYGTGSIYGTGAYGTQAGYGGNPCAVYYQQYGVMYYPSMVGGQMMCVSQQ